MEYFVWKNVGVWLAPGRFPICLVFCLSTLASFFFISTLFPRHILPTFLTILPPGACGLMHLSVNITGGEVPGHTGDGAVAMPGAGPFCDNKPCTACGGGGCHKRCLGRLTFLRGRWKKSGCASISATDPVNRRWLGRCANACHVICFAGIFHCSANERLNHGPTGVQY